jgi:hypothetical protein
MQKDNLAAMDPTDLCLFSMYTAQAGYFYACMMFPKPVSILGEE